MMSRFSLEISLRDAANGLYASLKAVLANRGATLDFDAATKAHTEQVAKWLIDSEGAPGLLLCGSVGNGKTSMAKAVAWLIRYVTEKEQGTRGMLEPHFHSAKSICRLYSDDRKRYEAIVTDPMIIIDDMGDEPTEQMHYGSVITPITDLLEERYARRLMTIVTTNLSATDIEEKYGARIRDRLRESMTMVVYKNSSYRRAR
jgi:DNA replication protein DnaC